MIELRGREIRISRGDTAQIAIDLQGDMLPSGTTALVTLGRRPGCAQPLWQKVLDVQEGSAELTLQSTETNYAPGVYWWDLRVKTPDGQVQTPFAPQPFEILEVVGHVNE